MSYKIYDIACGNGYTNEGHASCIIPCCLSAEYHPGCTQGTCATDKCWFAGWHITGEKYEFTAGENFCAGVRVYEVISDTVHTFQLFIDKMKNGSWVEIWHNRISEMGGDPAIEYASFMYGPYPIRGFDYGGNYRFRLMIDGGNKGQKLFTVTGPEEPKYYDCVNNQCVEKADGPYDDSTCMGMCAPAPPDKYYDCVNGKCIETAGGQYKNDPTCAGACAAAPPADDMLPLILGLGAIGASVIYFMAKKKR